jgi:hypothetical protein
MGSNTASRRNWTIILSTLPAAGGPPRRCGGDGRAGAKGTDSGSLTGGGRGCRRPSRGRVRRPLATCPPRRGARGKRLLPSSRLDAAAGFTSGRNRIPLAAPATSRPIPRAPAALRPRRHDPGPHPQPTGSFSFRVKARKVRKGEREETKEDRRRAATAPPFSSPSPFALSFLSRFRAKGRKTE